MPHLNQIDIDHQNLIELYRQALSTEGSFEELEKKVSQRVIRLMVSDKIERKNDWKRSQKLAKSIPAFVRLGAALLPSFLIVAGLTLLGSAVVPVIGFYVKNIPQERTQRLIAPIPEETIIDVSPLVIAQGRNNESLDQYSYSLRRGPIIVNADLDYTNLSNWFNDSGLPDLRNRSSLLSQEVGEYILEIPKIDIEDAVVKIGGTDLDKSLIQYPGTSLPGKHGSPVVFGHSLLRQFYNPRESNPRRYNSIFSYIMTLNEGDRIHVYYGDVKYTYAVIDKKEIKPDDTYILSQDYSVRQLKLVTCVPEGTYLRRGVVTAQLVRE